MENKTIQKRAFKTQVPWEHCRNCSFFNDPWQLIAVKAPLLTEAEAAAAPDSNFGGVQIGAITYSWRSMPGGVENIIKYCNEAGISSIELMSGDVETYLGAPKNPMQGMMGPCPPAPPPLHRCRRSCQPHPQVHRRPQVLRSVRQLTPEQKAAVDKI